MDLRYRTEIIYSNGRHFLGIYTHERNEPI